MEIPVFWDIAPYCPYVNRRFRGTYRLHFQGLKSVVQETSVRAVGRAEWAIIRDNSYRDPYLLPSGPYIIIIPTDRSFCPSTCSHVNFFLGWFYILKMEVVTFLRNVGSHTDYAAIYPRRWQFSQLPLWKPKILHNLNIFKSLLLNKCR
jgi:hypothetical protein